MDSWMISILFATILYGILNFLFKIAAEKEYNGDCLVSIVGATVALLSFGTILVTATHPFRLFAGAVGGYALLNGFCFALGSIAKVGALKKAPAAIVFPLNRLNTVLVMLIGFLFFHEMPRPLQLVGMAAGLGVLFIIALEQFKDFNRTGNPAIVMGVALSIGSAIATSLSMTTGKLLAESSANRLAYICLSYTLVCLFTLGKYSVTTRESAWITPFKNPKMLLYGFGIGALNYVGYFLVLKAFGSGPISLSQAVFSSSIIVPILLSRVVYHERLTHPRMWAIVLAVISVILISMN